MNLYLVQHMQCAHLSSPRHMRIQDAPTHWCHAGMQLMRREVSQLSIGMHAEGAQLLHRLLRQEGGQVQRPRAEPPIGAGCQCAILEQLQAPTWCRGTLNLNGVRSFTPVSARQGPRNVCKRVGGACSRTRTVQGTSGPSKPTHIFACWAL